MKNKLPQVYWHQRSQFCTEDEPFPNPNSQVNYLHPFLSHLPSTFLSWPTVTSQPGNTLAARTGEIQHKPMGFLALWKAWSVDFTCSLTVQSLPSTAQEHRFFATPKPPKNQTKTKNKCSNARHCYKTLNPIPEKSSPPTLFFFYNIIMAYIGLWSYYAESFQHMKHDGFTMLISMFLYHVCQRV